MSSIFGKCHTDEIPVSPGDLELMRDELNHWNADDKNVWISDSVGLGHLMLYNTPESLNEQLPLHDSVSGHAITADARIDNREELFSLLQIITPDEKSLPDSSLILLLYKKYGTDCVKYIVGDFAFAIWDARAQKLFCARDQMGVKPFFYYHRDHFFAFATEKKGLLCLPGLDKTIDKQFFYNQVILPAIQAADTTLYKYIRRLPPANILVFHRPENKLALNKYWTLDAYSELKLQRKEDYYDGLRHHFETAVKCRLRSVYPVGAELSGGMDSSAITGAANYFLGAHNRKIITFSNSYDEFIEQKYIEEVIKFNGIDDYVFVTKDTWDDPLDEVDFSLKVNDGLEFRSMLWQMGIKHAAAGKNVRVLLSGFPGDEMVTYMGQFYFLDNLDNKEYVKYFTAEKREWPFNKLKPFIPQDIQFALHKLKNIFTLNGRQIKQATDFLKVPLKYRINKGDVVWEDSNYMERFKSYRHFQKYRLLKSDVPLRMEAESRLGIYFKTEPRFPMADIRLTQFYLSMPNHLKYDGMLRRSAYRAAVGKYLPEMVLQRDDKKGSIAPFRAAPGSIATRQKTLLEMLNIINKKNPHRNTLISEKEGYNITNIKYIEILRWLIKNFGVLDN